MKFIVFYLQSINYLEGPGRFFSSAAIIRRLRKYTATPPSLRKDIPWSLFFLCFHSALLLTNVQLRKHNRHDVATHMNCINS